MNKKYLLLTAFFFLCFVSTTFSQTGIYLANSVLTAGASPELTGDRINETNLSSVQYKFVAPATVQDGSTQADIFRAEPITITKPIDLSSIKILKFMSGQGTNNGNSVPLFIRYYVSRGATVRLAYEIKLDPPYYFTSVSASADNSCTTCVSQSETYEITYTKITITDNSSVDTKGNPLPTQTFTWNFLSNTSNVTE